MRRSVKNCDGVEKTAKSLTVWTVLKGRGCPFIPRFIEHAIALHIICGINA
jgi:hypothetical protein